MFDYNTDGAMVLMSSTANTKQFLYSEYDWTNCIYDWLFIFFDYFSDRPLVVAVVQN